LSELVLIRNSAGSPQHSANGEQYQDTSDNQERMGKFGANPPTLPGRAQEGIESAEQTNEHGGNAENEEETANADDPSNNALSERGVVRVDEVKDVLGSSQGGGIRMKERVPR
jgi:hypothetical protein